MASDDDDDEDDVEDVSDDDDDDDGDNDDNELNESKGEVRDDGEGNQKTLWIIPCKFLFFSSCFLRFKFLLLWLLGMG